MKTTAATLTLTQDGDKLGGTFTSEAGDGKVISGRATVEKVEFAVAIGAGQRDVTLNFEGQHKPDDDTLAGTMKSPFGPPTEWKAARVKAGEQPANPVAISLETDDAKPQTSDAELPSELESDRLAAAGPPGDDLLLQNGTILTGAGQTLTDTDLLIRDGKIAAIGPDLVAEESVTKIDVAGRFLMPGIIDTHSHIMISGGVNEFSQSVVPEVRVKDVVRSDDPAEYRALAAGVTTARLLHGSSNTIGGQDAVVKLRYGEPAAAHIVQDAPQGVKFALGENPKRHFNRFPATRMGVEATIKRSFYEALAYRREWQKYEAAKKAAADGVTALPEPRRDLRLEALVDILEGRSFIHCHCYRADEILMLLRIADELGIKVRSLQHVLEGYKVAPEIAAHGASCSTFSDWWEFKIEALDATPFNATLLWKAGINTVIKSDDAELMRHLPVEAAKSLRYGNMPEHAALAMVTLNSARELGLDQRIGSIEVGKDGDVAVFNGHPFNAFSRCELTVIDGRVRFQRDRQPTAMSAGSRECSKGPHPLMLAPAEVRERKLDLSISDHGLYALRGATIHPVDAPDLVGTVLIENGRIAAVGADVAVPESATAIDLAGFHVYPGLIDAGTTLGINEIRLIEITQDFAESGRIQPDVRAGSVVNADSDQIAVSRAGGVTTALLRPHGILIGGQCAFVQLAGWPTPELVLNDTAGLSIDWPADPENQHRLREFFAQARVYERIQSQPEDSRPDVVRDPRFEAMLSYLRGELPVFIEADSRKAIAEALLFAEEQQINLVLTGAADAWKLAAEINTRNVPLIVGPTHRGPVEDWDPLDAPYTNAARLYEAGVLFCIRSNDASNSRNAPFHAALAVAYGLPEEDALKSVTLNAAKVLGVDRELGSIKVGKRANLIITDGSPLQPATQIKGLFIAGRPFAPDSKQTRLYDRYAERLNP
ncbi:MAG: amidohydrolase family protein [Planctomycetaceae bacterium]